MLVKKVNGIGPELIITFFKLSNGYRANCWFLRYIYRIKSDFQNVSIFSPPRITLTINFWPGKLIFALFLLLIGPFILKEGVHFPLLQDTICLITIGYNPMVYCG